MALSLTEDVDLSPGRGLINVAVMAVVRAAAREETRVIRCVHEAHLHIYHVDAGRGRMMCGMLQVACERVMDNSGSLTRSHFMDIVWCKCSAVKCREFGAEGLI